MAFSQRTAPELRITPPKPADRELFVFYACGVRFRVVETAEPLDDVWADCSRAEGLIRLSPDCPMAERRRIFFHEVGHVLAESGMPDARRDIEAWCDYFGAHVADVVSQLLDDRAKIEALTEGAS